MARSFWNTDDLAILDYENLPPLVPEGEDREACIDEIVEYWSTPSPAGTPPDNFGEFEGWVDQHVEAGGFVVQNCDFRDDNTGDPIDFGEILRRVEEEIGSKDESASNDSLSCPEMLIAIRGCRIELCNASGLQIRPSFVTFHVHFSDNALFANAQFDDNACFRHARFDANAHFFLARFGDSADFIGAQFGAGANFGRAQFGDHADFLAEFGDHANFSDARFGAEANFASAIFGYRAAFLRVQFGDNAGFDMAWFGDSTAFTSARFGSNADFGRAQFGANASFRLARFGRGVCLEDADLSGADLRNASGLILNNTLIRGARFSPRANDPWSKLRQTYTGPRMVFTLLLLVLFFTPYLLRTAGWVGVHHSQERLTAIIEELQHRHAEGTQPLREDFRADLNAIEALLPSADSERWRATRVGWLVLSWDQGWRYWALALILLGYNFIRLGLTLVVAPMRDEEERSGHSPVYRIEGWEKFRRLSKREDVDPSPENLTWKERLRARVTKLPMLSHCLRWFTYLQWGWRSSTEAYGWLIPIHWIAKGLAIIAAAAFIYNTYLWLSYSVYIPIF